MRETISAYGARTLRFHSMVRKVFAMLGMPTKVTGRAGLAGAALVSIGLIAILAITACQQSRAADTRNENSEWEAKVRTFMQRRFKLPDGSDIKFGPLEESVFPGLLSRSVTITTGQGASAKLTLFTDGKSSKFVLGEVLDTAGDPWGRVNLSGVHLEDRATLGPLTAPITMVEFADFECPFCAHAFGVVEAAVQTRYRGRVRLIFKNFPLRGHSWARAAAIAAECVKLQNPEAFWPFAGDIYAAQPQITDQNLRRYVEQFSAKLNLDSTVLNACMMSSAPEKTIDQDIRDAIAVQVNSTPTLFVNGVPVIGVPDEKTLDLVIASELHPKTAKSH